MSASLSLAWIIRISRWQPCTHDKMKPTNFSILLNKSFVKKLKKLLFSFFIADGINFHKYIKDDFEDFNGLRTFAAITFCVCMCAVVFFFNNKSIENEKKMWWNERESFGLCLVMYIFFPQQRTTTRKNEWQ